MASKFPIDDHTASRLTTFLLGPLIGLIFSASCVAIGYARVKKGRPARTFLCMGALLFIATVAGWFLGDGNYWLYMATFYNIQDLDTYVNVNPSREPGESFMDAGQIYFKDSTYIAVENAMAFRNNGVYCVAPIVRQPLANQGSYEQVKIQGTFDMPESGTFDFWAIGVNCCAPDGMGFSCGEYSNPYARAGLRLIRDDQRAFFHMAVQEWSAQYGLPTKHPLFFYWVQDPLGTITATKEKGEMRFYTHLAIFMLGNFFGACALQVATKSMGIV